MHPSLMRVKIFALFPHVEALEMVTGMKISTGDFIKYGERAFTIERMFNMREGLSKADDVLPERIMEDLAAGQKIKMKDKLTKMLAEYYRIRRYDQQGRPSRKLLQQLNL